MKFQFITQSFLVYSAGATGASTVFTVPENILNVRPPANLKVTRVTFQVNSIDYVNISAFELLISNTMPQNAVDGYKLMCLYDSTLNVAIPSSYTIESMNGNVPLDCNFYVANSGTDKCYLTVIFEGYYE